MENTVFIESETYVGQSVFSRLIEFLNENTDLSISEMQKHFGKYIKIVLGEETQEDSAELIAETLNMGMVDLVSRFTKKSLAYIKNIQGIISYGGQKTGATAKVIEQTATIKKI